VLLSFPDSLSGLFLALLGVYLFFTSFAAKLHFFLGVFFHFITGADKNGGPCAANRFLAAGRAANFQAAPKIFL
jgi:hypothetical protein